MVKVKQQLTKRKQRPAAVNPCDRAKGSVNKKSLKKLDK
jgi:hypothetical protein